MNLGEKLRMLRKSVHEMTLVEVAQQTGLSVSFLSDLERGQTRPSLNTLEKLSKFYEVNINELLQTIDKGDQQNILPPSLQELMIDYKIDPDILDLMLTVEQRAKKQPTSKEDWLKYYYSLKMLLGR